MRHVGNQISRENNTIHITSQDIFSSMTENIIICQNQYGFGRKYGLFRYAIQIFVSPQKQLVADNHRGRVNIVIQRV
jgi:hypothetical protein